ncbi:MAG: hypothetical protein Q7I94_03305 [Candidatus Contubernalis sp.]|nr:hypothetical protein [Candidatus Contubernalis sp.]
MYCPLCGSVDTGKVATDQYYCWHCLIEFNMNKKKEINIYYVEDDGTLVDMGINPQEKIYFQPQKAT